MIVQFLFRRQCLILLLSVGLLIMFGSYVIEKFTDTPSKETDMQRLIKLHQRQAAARHEDGPEILVDNDGDNQVVNDGDKGNGVKVGIPVARVVVDGAKTIQREKSVLGGVGCKVTPIDPFHKDVLKMMHDFGKHKCFYDHGARVDIVEKTLHLNLSDVNFAQIRKILDHPKNGSSYDDFRYLIKPTLTLLLLSPGKSGSIQNDASKRCIMPGAFNKEHPADEIGMIFSKRCRIPEAKFKYTAGGYIVHQMTKKCLGPKGALKVPPENTALVIGTDCSTKFDVINNGVLQMKGAGSCIHPMWGGAVPAEEQKLCLYPECGMQGRLTYHWYELEKGAEDKAKITSKSFQVKDEMSHVKITMLDERVINSYVLSVQPKPLPTVQSTEPNIFVISLEEVSAPHFKRKLPLTYAMMKKHGFLEYTKHAAVSPIAKVNLMTMMNGHSSNEGEMESSIFRSAKKHNYMTLFSADNPHQITIGKGVEVDHSSIPFFQILKKKFNVPGQSYCVTGQPIYDISFNYLTSFLKAYPSNSKLAILLLSELTQVNFNLLGYMDEKFSNLVERLSKLENSIIFIQTLKGGEKGSLAETKQGIMEIKRPLLASYLSEDLRDKIKFEPARSKGLSSAYDLHVTLHELLAKVKQKHNYGKSLLRSHAERNCLQAAIHPSMCPCV